MKMFITLTEICQFQFSILTDQQVLRFQVTVQDLLLVAEVQAAEQLEEKESCIVGIDASAILFLITTKVRVLLVVQSKRTIRLHSTDTQEKDRLSFYLPQTRTQKSEKFAYGPGHEV